MADLPITSLTSLQIANPINPNTGLPLNNLTGQGGFAVAQMTGAQMANLTNLNPPYTTTIPAFGNGTIVYNTDGLGPALQGGIGFYTYGGATINVQGQYVPGTWTLLNGAFGQGNVSFFGNAALIQEGQVAVFSDNGSGNFIAGQIGVVLGAVALNVPGAIKDSTATNNIGLSGVGFLQFSNGLGNQDYGAIYIESLSPVSFTENNGNACTIFTEGIPTANSSSPSAILEIQTTSGALLVSRMTVDQMNALPHPQNGMLVYVADTNNNNMMMYTSGSWSVIAEAGGGGGGTVTSVGLTSSQASIFTFSNSPITQSGNLGIAIQGELLGLSSLNTNGLVTRTGAATYTASLTPSVTSIGLNANSTTTTIAASSAATEYTFTLPSAPATNTTQFLYDTGNGTTAWGTPSGTGTGNVNGPTGTVTSTTIATYSTATQLSETTATIDGSGNFSTTGYAALGTQVSTAGAPALTVGYTTNSSLLVVDGAGNLTTNGNISSDGAAIIGSTIISSATSAAGPFALSVGNNGSSGPSLTVDGAGNLTTNNGIYIKGTLSNIYYPHQIPPPNGYLNGYGAGSQTASTLNALYSIWANSHIGTEGIVIASGTLAPSSRNIKDILDHGASMETEAVDLFTQIRFKKYEYKDKVKNSNGVIYGMIAEELREVMPHSVSNNQAFIPNIMQLADIVDIYNTDNSFIYNLSFKDKSFALDKTICEGDRIEVITEKGKKEGIVKSITNSSISIKLATSLEGDIFIYGTYGDCPAIFKNNVFELGMVVLQKMVKEIEALKAEIAELKSK